MSETETLFETRWLGLYRIGHWDFAKRPNADASVGILAVTPADEVVLVEQFRIPVQKKVIEVPAGRVFGDPAVLSAHIAGLKKRVKSNRDGILFQTI